MRPSTFRLFVTGALLAQTVFEESPNAATAPPALLALDFRACPAAPATDVRSMVSVEIRRPVVLFGETATAAPGAPTATVVRVICAGLHAEIHVDDPLTGGTFPRVVDLSAAAPVARSHLLALSIVELLAASWLEFQRSPPSESVRSGGTVALRTREATLEGEHSDSGAWRSLRATAVVATQRADRLSSWGAGAIVAGSPGAHVGWLADLGFQHGGRSFALGRVTADTASVLLALLTGASLGSLSLRGGLGVRGGGAWLSGIPANPGPAVGGAVSGFWWGPAALLEASVVIRGRLVLELTLDAGRVLLPVVATVQGADPVAVDGTWMRGTLGVGLTL